MKQSESNPSMQCSVCGQWKRLTRKSGPDAGMQTFYPVCGDNGQYEHKKPVCYECCKNNCPYNTEKNELPVLPETNKCDDWIAGTTQVQKSSEPLQEKSRPLNGGKRKGKHSERN